MRWKMMFIVGLAGWFGCHDSHQRSISHAAPLLGARTPDVVESFRKTCVTGRLITVDAASQCSLDIGSYEIVADANGRIYGINMILLDDRQVHDTFSRVVASILPDKTRPMIEASIDKYSEQPGSYEVYSGSDGSIVMRVTVEQAGETKGRKSLSWSSDIDVVPSNPRNH